MAVDIPKAARIILEDGTEFEGTSFGYEGSVSGEVIFYTGSSGNNLVLSDPACRSTIMVMAYPIIGNGGSPSPETDTHGLEKHYESSEPQIAGLVVLDYCDTPSHYTSSKTLAQWLKRNRVPAVSGIDTRALIHRLRDKGFMRGKILVEGTKDVSFSSSLTVSTIASVSIKKPIVYGTGKHRIILIDCGVKNEIIRAMLRRNTTIIRVPYNFDYETAYKDAFDGIIVAGGPGDPTSASAAISHLKSSLNDKKPIFGIGQGGVVLALASGAEAFHMPAGHRGQNIPCLDLETARCYITSQNHGYGIRQSSLPSMWETRYINNNDQEIEGICTKDHLFSAVLFQPEGVPGPHDTDFLFDEFIEILQTGGKTK